MYALDGQHRLSGIKRFLGEGNMFDQEESVGVIFRGHHNTLEGKAALSPIVHGAEQRGCQSGQEGYYLFG